MRWYCKRNKLKKWKGTYSKPFDRRMAFAYAHAASIAAQAAHAVSAISSSSNGLQDQIEKLSRAAAISEVVLKSLGAACNTLSSVSTGRASP